jgi:hypothetical protein
MTAKSFRNCLAVFAAAATAFVPFCESRASELFSESVNVPPLKTAFGNPVSGWNKFNILLSGAPVLPFQNGNNTSINPYAVNGFGTITTSNPFVPLDSDAVEPVGPGPVKLLGLNRVTYSGGTPINPSNIPNQNLSNPPGQVQFGLTGPVNNSVMNILAQHWQGSYVVGATDGTISPDFVIGGGLPRIGQTGAYLRGVPVVSLTPHPAPPSAPPTGTSFKYIVDFIQFTQNGMSGSEWVEFPYLPGQQPTFTYGGWADAVNFIHFTNTEVQLSDTQIPIDDLNFACDPLGGGLTTPAFAVVENAADVVPEPLGAGLVFMGMGLLLLRLRSALAGK